MVLEMRGTILPGHEWDVMVDLFFYRDPEETKELEEEEALVAPDYGAVAEYAATGTDNWGGDWGAGDTAAPPAGAPAPTGADWTAAPAPPAEGVWDAAAAPPAATPGWEQGVAPVAA
ncbi:40S ribosomal protein SA-like [Panicum virgatum]|uniref:40S ribosomal protein SA-like n=1 Tax=Panicum virgatum TaxID=38727 RepID=UPI0019D59773|nr:40S ribosomal protein SA-like [Panicum virgatum]